MKPVRNAKHMARVAQLPCVICGAPPPSVVHHVISGRYSQRRAPDTETIPLCWSHHDAQSPHGLHHSPGTWKRLHGADRSYLPRVAEMLADMEARTI